MALLQNHHGRARQRALRTMSTGLVAGTWFLRAVAMCSVAYGMLQTWAYLSGRQLFAGAEVDARLRLPDLPQILEATPRESSQIYLESLPAPLRLLCASPSVLAAFSSAAVALLLIVVIREIAAGRAFDRRSRHHTTAVGLLIIASGVSQGVLDSSAVATLANYVRPGVVPEIQDTYSFVAMMFPSWPISWVVVGLVTLVVTVALRDGARLEEEAGLVV